MAPKNRRNRRHGRNQADASEPTDAPAAAATSSRKRRPARRRAHRRDGSQAKLFIFGAAAVVVLLVGAVVFQVINGAGAASAFSFSVYQGEEILGGSEIDFADLLDDGKPIVLNFWAGDCPPCRAEMPALQRVYEQHEDDIIFVGLDVGVFTGLGTRRSGLRLLEELNVTYPAGAPPNRTPMVNYSVRSMPTTIFFGADGQIFRRWDGGISERDMNEIVSAMVAEAS